MPLLKFHAISRTVPGPTPSTFITQYGVLLLNTATPGIRAWVPTFTSECMSQDREKVLQVYREYKVDPAVRFMDLELVEEENPDHC